MNKARMLFYIIFLLILSPSSFAQGDHGRSAGEFLSDFNTIGNAILSFGMLLGIIFVIIALFKFKKHGENPVQNPLMSALMTFVAGLLLISIRFLLGAFSETLFNTNLVEGGEGYYLSVGYSAESVVTNSGNTTTPLNSATGAVFIGFAMVVGLFYFVKGIFLLHEMGSSGASNTQTRNKAIWHIIGGAIAFNVSEFACILSNTLGFQGMCL